MHVSNPFTASKRREQRDQNIMDTHHKERQQREDTRAAAWDSAARQQQVQRDMGRGGPGGNKAATLAERSKYQFEADSEDDEMEGEIDSNLDALHGAAGRLKGLAGAMGQEVDTQNKHIARITDKVSLSLRRPRRSLVVFILFFLLTYPLQNLDRPRRRPDRHEPRSSGPHQISASERDNRLFCCTYSRPTKRNERVKPRKDKKRRRRGGQTRRMRDGNQKSGGYISLFPF